MSPNPNNTGPWLCFHCAELFEDRELAADHFGRDWFCEDEGPACIQMLTEGEKAIVNDVREAGRLLRKAEEAQEQAEYEAGCWRSLAVELTKSAETHHANDLRFAWESIEGRALAAEAALEAGPRWLAAGLRRLAEFRWRLRQP